MTGLGPGSSIPSPKKRRIAAVVYAVTAAAVVLLPGGAGRFVVASLLLALSIWHWISAWELRVDQHRALSEAAARVSFPVGHASAAVGFRGWRARPEWQVILYSADEPPTQRALVRLDAVTGEVRDEPYLEDVPPPT